MAGAIEVKGSSSIQATAIVIFKQLMNNYVMLMVPLIPLLRIPFFYSYTYWMLVEAAQAWAGHEDLKIKKGERNGTRLGHVHEVKGFPFYWL